MHTLCCLLLGVLLTEAAVLPEQGDDGGALVVETIAENWKRHHESSEEHPSPVYIPVHLSSEEPDSRYQEPASSYQEPDSRYQEPDSRYQEPESSYQEPDSGYAGPDSSSSEERIIRIITRKDPIKEIIGAPIFEQGGIPLHDITHILPPIKSALRGNHPNIYEHGHKFDLGGDDSHGDYSDDSLDTGYGAPDSHYAGPDSGSDSIGDGHHPSFFGGDSDDVDSRYQAPASTYIGPDSGDDSGAANWNAGSGSGSVETGHFDSSREIDRFIKYGLHRGLGIFGGFRVPFGYYGFGKGLHH